MTYRENTILVKELPDGRTLAEAWDVRTASCDDHLGFARASHLLYGLEDGVDYMRRGRI